MSPALLETAKVLGFLLSLVLHVFGVLLSLWLHHKKYQSHKCCWPSKGVKDCTNNGFLCKVLLQTCATFIPGFLLETFARRICKVPLQTNLKPTHHLLARWQGQVRRCLKTIHAINLFPPKWLPINCFTLTKDGLQTLNITAGHTFPDLHSKLFDIIKYPVPLQGTVLLQTCATCIPGFL